MKITTYQEFRLGEIVVIDNFRHLPDNLFKNDATRRARTRWWQEKGTIVGFSNTNPDIVQVEHTVIGKFGAQKLVRAYTRSELQKLAAESPESLAAPDELTPC